MKNKLILAFLSIFIVACSTSKKYMIVEPYNFKTNCIHTAIEDFVENTELAKTDSVFEVRFIDNVYNEGKNIDIYDSLKNYSYSKYVSGSLIPNISAVEIISSSTHIENEKYMFLPTHSLIYNGNLFFWTDKNTMITSIVKEELKFFNKIDSVDYSRSFMINESTKAATYFICKADILNNKRVESNLSHYQPPILHCHQIDSISNPTYPIMYQYPYYQLTLFADHSFEAVAAKESISFSMKDDDFIEPIAQGTFNFLDKDVVELVSSNFTHSTKELEYKLTKSHNKSHDSIYIEVLLSKSLMNRLIRPYRIEYVINGIHYKAQNNEVVIARNTLDSKSSDVSNISLEIFIYAKYPPENGYQYNKIVCENFNISSASTFVFDLPFFTNAFLHRIYFNHQIMPLY